ncbi:hypothetical protein ACFX1S_035219 [Malus domestica]
MEVNETLSSSFELEACGSLRLDSQAPKLEPFVAVLVEASKTWNQTKQTALKREGSTSLAYSFSSQKLSSGSSDEDAGEINPGRNLICLMVGQEEGNMRSIQAELRLIRDILSKQLKSTLLDLTLIRVPRIPILESKDQINIIIRATICSIIINSKELILNHIQLPLLNHLSRQHHPLLLSAKAERETENVSAICTLQSKSKS